MYTQYYKELSPEVRTCQQIACSSCVSAFPIASSDSPAVAQGRRLKFFFAGDSLLHEPVYKDAENEDGAFDFGRQLDSLLDIVKDYDLAYYNQETILGGKELGLSGYPRFNSPQEFGEYMVSKGFNLVSTANNHCFDLGIAGINASSAFWSRFDQVLVAGTYATEEESRLIPSFTVKGVRVALMAYTYGTNNTEPKNDWQVNIYLGHEEEMLARVRQASEENDVVIVAMHWGLEYTHEVHEEQRKLARRLAKAGATIIIGSHSHVVAPFEWIDGVPVFYSMGNLISSQIGIDRRTGLIGSLVIDVDNDGKAVVSDARTEMIFVQYKGDESILCNDIRVISYDMVSDAVLPEAGYLQEEYMRIVKSLDDRISFGLRDKKQPGFPGA